MSKYIKLEDAIAQVKTEFYGGGYQEWLEISIDNLINRIANLPTIEVSEDCISREQVRAKLDYISYAEKDPISIAKRIVDDAPSVVPIAEQYSTDGEVDLGDCNICRFAGCSECDDCLNGSQWVRMTKEDDVEE